jgi:hypothetical protein
MDFTEADTHKEIITGAVVPHLERVSSFPNLWGRHWEDAFLTSIVEFGGLPKYFYDVIVVRTGELTIRSASGNGPTFTLHDDRVKGIYETLEASVKNQHPENLNQCSHNLY